jgi:hypothetical protein
MRKMMTTAAALALAFVALGCQARDSIDGSLVVVRPHKDGTFETGEYRFGKAELFGYIGDLKDTKKITGVLMRDGAKATPEQKHALAEIAREQQLDATIELDGKQQPLIDPLAPPAPANTTPAAPAAAAQ